jgi:hypothetical protein
MSRLLLPAVLVLCGFVCAVYSLAEEDTAQVDDRRIVKWEYRIETSAVVDASSALNRFGGEGWELVAVLQASDGRAVFYLKRPVMEVSAVVRPRLPLRPGLPTR